MEFCESHWNYLQQAIADRGLQGLISETREEAEYKAARMQRGDTNLAYFDPLIAAHLSICSAAMRATGRTFSFTGEGVDHCPVCYLKHDDWIEFAADDIRAFYDEQVRIQAQ